MSTDTTLLRALAVLLIVNSHLEAFYPFPKLAADGLLGDTLFFFLSGYGLFLSARTQRRGFVDWYGRRLARIYPALVITVFVFHYLATAGWRTWGPADFLLEFGWGRAYPFVGQIVVFYLLFFALLGCRSPRVFPAMLTLLFLPYAAVPVYGRGAGDLVFHAFHWVFYFQAMLLGAWVAARPALAPPARRFTPIALAAIGFLYVATRIGVAAGPLRGWYFLPHLLALPLIILLLRATRSEAVVALWERSPILSGLAGFLAGITLEMYLMHYQVLTIEWVRALAFPLNVAVFLTLSTLASTALAGACASLRRRPAARRPGDVRDRPVTPPLATADSEALALRG